MGPSSLEPLVVRYIILVIGAILAAELCEWQGFYTKTAPLQQEVQHAEVQLSLCIPFYDCFNLGKPALFFVFTTVSLHVIVGLDYALLGK